MKPFFIFRFFPFFCQIAKRKVLVFCSQCFAYYTTTRENRELRLVRDQRHAVGNYTTTRENRELRPGTSQLPGDFNYTTTRENRELRPSVGSGATAQDYTTTRENWELRLMLLNLTRIVESVLASSEDSVEQELRRLELEFEKLQMD